MEKICTKCNKLLDNRMFSVNTTNLSGLHSHCKNCRSNSMKIKRLINQNDPSPDLIEKECSTCKNMKSVKDFSLNKSSKDGYHNRCKKCHNESRRKK